MGSGKTVLIDSILHNYYGIENIKRIKNNILYISSLREQGISFYKNDVKVFVSLQVNYIIKKNL